MRKPHCVMVAVLLLASVAARTAVEDADKRDSRSQRPWHMGSSPHGQHVFQRVHASMQRGHILQLSHAHWERMCAADGLCRQHERKLMQATTTPVLAAPPCNVSCRAAQRQALINLYDAAQGGSWVHTDGWSGAVGDHCSWYGVTCCPEITSSDHLLQGCGQGGVVKLELSENNLNGSFSDQGASSLLVDFMLEALSPTLRAADLTGNNLQGTLPEVLSLLTQLTELTLDSNQLTGTLPPGLSAMSQLQVLSLSSNRLTGTIPTAAYRQGMSSLMWLDTGRNNLTGPAPLELLSLPNLDFLDSSHNRHTGQLVLPANLDSGGGLAVLDLSTNYLTGTIPDGLATLLVLLLDLSDNQLTGTLPKNLHSMRPHTIKLSSNALTGTLPSAFPPRTIKVLDLSDNKLSGSISGDLSRARDLQQLLLHTNNFTGPLPDNLSDLSELEVVDVDHTLLRSAAPATAQGNHLLPPWLEFTESREGWEALSMLCLSLKIRTGSGHDHTTRVTLDPFYYRFWGCSCILGFTAVYEYEPLSSSNSSVANFTGAVTQMHCVPSTDVPPPRTKPGALRFPWWAVLIIALVGGLLVLAVAGLLWFRMSPSFVSYRHGTGRKRPPNGANGKPVTLVLTDVQGSTSLWEWDTEVMSAAIDLHDRLLRQYMAQFCGYEVQTEGDAFLVAFHEPFDAVAWCLATQLALHNCAWPRELFRHESACIETQEDLELAAGLADRSSRMEGGQATGSDQPPQMVSEVLPHLNWPQAPGSADNQGNTGPLNIIDQLRHSGSATHQTVTGVLGGPSGGGGPAPLPRHSSQDYQQYRAYPPPWQEDVNNPPSYGASAPKQPSAYAPELADWARYSRQGVLFRGLRVRCGVATGSADVVQVHKVTGRCEYFGEVMRRVQAISDLPSGGQILLDQATFVGIHSSLNELGASVIEAIIHRKASVPIQKETWPSTPSRTQRALNGLVTDGQRPQSPSDFDFSDTRIHGGGRSLGSHGAPRRSLMGITAQSARWVAERLGPRAVQRRQQAGRLTDAARQMLRAQLNSISVLPTDMPVEEGRENVQHLAGLMAFRNVSIGMEEGSFLAGGLSPSITSQAPAARKALEAADSPEGTERMATVEVGAGAGLADVGRGPSSSLPRPAMQANMASLLLGKVGALHPLQHQSSAGGMCSRSEVGSTAPEVIFPSNSQLLREGSGVSSGVISQAQLSPTGLREGTSPRQTFATTQPSPVLGAASQLSGRDYLDSPTTASLPPQARVWEAASPGGARMQPQQSGWTPAAGAEVAAAATPCLDIIRPANYQSQPDASALHTTAGLSTGDEPVSGDNLHLSDSNMANAAHYPHRGSLDLHYASRQSIEAQVEHQTLPAVSTQQRSPWGTTNIQGTSTLGSWGMNPRGVTAGAAAGAVRWLMPESSTTNELGASNSRLIPPAGSGSHVRALPMNPSHEFSEETGNMGPSTAGDGNTGPLARAADSQTNLGVGSARAGSVTAGQGRRVSITLDRRNSNGSRGRLGQNTNSGNARGGRRRLSQAPAIMVIDMGVFELQISAGVEFNDIAQVLVPGLEERARFFPRLDTSHQITPGYQDAPATLRAPLGPPAQPWMQHRPHYPPVTMVFCGMEKYQEMCAVNRLDAKDVLDVYNDCIRRTLLAAKGYECQELEGNYMIAFGNPADALEWCLVVQEAMTEVPWADALLALPGMAATSSPTNPSMVLLKGPRVKMGIYQGLPTKVVPHSTTGRADYFGPLVNRAARFCHAAAQGGQVIASRELVDQVLAQWIKPELLLLPLASGVMPAGVMPSAHSASVAAQSSNSSQLLPVSGNSAVSEPPSGGVGEPPSLRSSQQTGQVTGDAFDIPLPLVLHAVLDNAQVELSPWAYPPDLQAHRLERAMVELGEASHHSLTLGLAQARAPASPARFGGMPSSLLSVQAADPNAFDLSTVSRGAAAGAGREGSTTAKTERAASLHSQKSRHTPNLFFNAATGGQQVQEVSVATALGGATSHVQPDSLTSFVNLPALPAREPGPQLYPSPATRTSSLAHVLGGRHGSLHMPESVDRGSSETLFGPMPHLGRFLGSSMARQATWAQEDEAEEGQDEGFVIQEVPLEKVKRMDVAPAMLPASKRTQLEQLAEVGSVASPPPATADRTPLSHHNSVHLAGNALTRPASAMFLSRARGGTLPHDMGLGRGTSNSLRAGGLQHSSSVVSLSYMLQAQGTSATVHNAPGMAGSVSHSMDTGVTTVVGPRPAPAVEAGNAAPGSQPRQKQGCRREDAEQSHEYGGSRELTYLPRASLNKRTGPYKWLWAQELLVYDLGLYRFKGVLGQHAIVSIATARTAERQQESKVKKTKGERVEAGRGLIYRVQMRSTALTLQEEEAAARQASTIARQHEMLAAVLQASHARQSFTRNTSWQPPDGDNAAGLRRNSNRSFRIKPQSLASGLSSPQLPTLGALVEVAETGPGATSPRHSQPSGEEVAGFMGSGRVGSKLMPGLAQGLQSITQSFKDALRGASGARNTPHRARPTSDVSAAVSGGLWQGAKPHSSYASQVSSPQRSLQLPVLSPMVGVGAAEVARGAAEPACQLASDLYTVGPGRSGAADPGLPHGQRGGSAEHAVVGGSSRRLPSGLQQQSQRVARRGSGGSSPTGAQGVTSASMAWSAHKVAMGVHGGLYAATPRAGDRPGSTTVTALSGTPPALWLGLRSGSASDSAPGMRQASDSAPGYGASSGCSSNSGSGHPEQRGSSSPAGQISGRSSVEQPADSDKGSTEVTGQLAKLSWRQLQPQRASLGTHQGRWSSEHEVVVTAGGTGELPNVHARAHQPPNAGPSRLSGSMLNAARAAAALGVQSSPADIPGSTPGGSAPAVALQPAQTTMQAVRALQQAQPRHTQTQPHTQPCAQLSLPTPCAVSTAAHTSTHDTAGSTPESNPSDGVCLTPHSATASPHMAPGGGSGNSAPASPAPGGVTALTVTPEEEGVGSRGGTGSDGVAPEHTQQQQ